MSQDTAGAVAAQRAAAGNGGDGRSPEEPALAAVALTKRYGVGRDAAAEVVGVHGVDIELYRGRVLALVGESGSGKSTIARILARLVTPDEGEITLHGRAVTGGAGHRDLWYRRHVQMIFQDPFATLNPVKTIAHHLRRPLAIHRRLRGCAADLAADELLDDVGIAPGADYLHRYPHELSGGQRQRVTIAAALAASPSVLLADEPTSMLDVSIRISLLNLIRSLAVERQLAVLFITHDLASARYVGDAIMVLKDGVVVEHGPIDEVLDAPRHPYTRLLLDAVPEPGGPAVGDDG